MNNTKHIVNVEVAVNRGDKWLLIKRSKKESHAGGTYALVGGKVEHSDQPTQTLESAAIREVHEETGIIVKEPLYFVYNSKFESKKGNSVINIVFLSMNSTGNPRIKLTDEVE